MRKFKKKYILGEGWPWYGDQNDMSISMCRHYEAGSSTIKLNIPHDLVNHVKKHPKYRLVLEKIE